MLTVIAVPYVLPEFMTAFSLCISIFIREDEYFEGNSILSHNRQTAYSRKFPDRKKGVSKRLLTKLKHHEERYNKKRIYLFVPLIL